MTPKKSTKSTNIHKKIKSLIQRNKASVLALLVVEKRVMILGNERLVSLAKNEHITIEDLAKELILLEKDKDIDTFSYKEVSTNHVILPKPSVKIRSASWSVIIARSILKEYLKIFNLGKGMPLKYHIKENEPAGWPQTLSFEEFMGVSYVNKEQATLIIESMIRYHAKVDPLTYYEPARKTEEHESGETSEEEKVADDIHKGNKEHGKRKKIDGHHDINDSFKNNDCYQTHNYGYEGHDLTNMPLHLDPSGLWYWDSYLHQWFPYQPANGGHSLNQ